MLVIKKVLLKDVQVSWRQIFQILKEVNIQKFLKIVQVLKL